MYNSFTHIKPMGKSKKYEFYYRSELSRVIANELQSLDSFRTDERYYRTELRVGRYRNIQRWLENKIQELEETEELLEHECAVTGKEYK